MRASSRRRRKRREPINNRLTEPNKRLQAAPFALESFFIGPCWELMAELVAEAVKAFERLRETKLLTSSATQLYVAIRSQPATKIHDQPECLRNRASDSQFPLDRRLCKTPSAPLQIRLGR